MHRLLSPRLRGLPREVWILVAGALITRAGSFVLPFFAIFLRDERNLSSTYVGTAVALFGAGSLVGAPVGGHVADLVGRKPVLAGANALQGAAFLVLFVTTHPAAVLLMCFAAGAFTEATRPASSAMLTDLTTADRRTDAFALWRLAINLGFAVGTSVGGLLIRFGFGKLFLADAATTMVFAAVVVLLLPETNPAHRSTGEQPGSYRQVFGDPVFRRFWVAMLLSALVFSQPVTTLGLVVTGRGVPESTWGLLYAFNGLLILLTEFWLVGKVARYDARVVLALSGVLVGAGFAATALAGRSVPRLALTVAIWTLGEILGASIAQAYLSRLAPPLLRGRYAGALGLAFGVAFTLGPLLGGMALDRSEAALWLGAIVVSAAAAFTFMTLPAPVVARDRRTGPTEAAPALP
jgi:predicted MFS family arabinose efflux permease